jgi:nucleoside-diphosphate-sugar epimerase
MRILITGNMGYIGPVLVRHLRQRFPDAMLLGFDTGLFAHCLTLPVGAGLMPETLLDVQYFGDVRNMPDAAFAGVDAVVHLAAISNDPMGSRFEAVTEAINRDASLRVAEQAHRAGVRAFVFASSCSVYGFAEGGPRCETDAVNPLTAYARSKIGSEEGLRQRDLSGMAVTCLRFATACGMSDRLRLDLVLNDFAAGALGNSMVTVLSDGTPWRPLIDVRDMARAIEWAIQRQSDDEAGPVLVVNVGSDERNHTVRELAEAVAVAVPGTEVSINETAPPDKRSYRVDFSLFRRLAPDHQPRERLSDSISGLVSGLRNMNFNDPDFRNSSFIRLKTLGALLASGQLGPDLTWQRDGK